MRYRILRLSYQYSRELGGNYLIETPQKEGFEIGGRIKLFITIPEAIKAKRTLIQQSKALNKEGEK